MQLSLEISGLQPIPHSAYSGTGTFCIPGSMVKPSSSLVSCSGVRSLRSELFLGQLNLPSATLLYKRRKPSPSHTRAFIRSVFLPQNRKMAPFLCGFRSNCCCIQAASPSIPFLRSV